MARDPEATKRRIFEAATDEFARHGIAGARIDRIAKHAGANKQLIYAYFGSKQALFDRVVTDQVARFHHEVHLDPEDVPAFAGAAFDFFTDNPAIVRLGSWHSLEAGQGVTRIEAIERSIARHLRALREAQAAGRIDSTVAPDELLVMIYALARAWVVATPELQPGETDERPSRLKRRRAVVEATRRLVSPSPPDNA
ncbi:MAG: transcriptional regulator [Actinomycetia bacterium]|jgi:AcrR family transcriptional regulator|nr:transcriptional regulator [Actinomycetes bacterium]